MSFSKHNIEDWIRQVSKELPNGKTLEEVKIKSWYYEHSGLPFGDAGIKTNSLESQGFLGVYDISGLDQDSILKVLQLGPEVIRIDIQTGEKVNIDLIDFNFVKPILNISNLSIEDSENLKKQLQNGYSDSVYNSFIFINSNIDIRPEDFIYVELNIENIPDKLSEVVSKIENGQKKYFFNLSLGTDLATNISLLRALRIIIENIKVALSCKDLVYKVSVSPETTLINNLNDESIIKLNFYAISSIIGLAEFIHFIPFNSDYNKARIALNMINVFKYESMLDLYNDATGGSYFFEDITNQTATNIWAELSKTEV